MGKLQYLSHTAGLLPNRGCTATLPSKELAGGLLLGPYDRHGYWHLFRVGQPDSIFRVTPGPNGLVTTEFNSAYTAFQAVQDSGVPCMSFQPGYKKLFPGLSAWGCRQPSWPGICPAPRALPKGGEFHRCFALLLPQSVHWYVYSAAC